MAVCEILRMGDPLLLEKAKPVSEFNTNDLDNLIQDLKDTMHHANGAGLAAPQIGVSLQVVIFGLSNNPRYPDAPAIEKQVLINPEIIVVDKDMVKGWEGCLSIPGMRGFVPRYKAIRYCGYNERGEFRRVEAEGFHARVVQHECDHLYGYLYPMRMTDMSEFGFTDVITRQISLKKSDPLVQ